jgi:hypothetical protein
MQSGACVIQFSSGREGGGGKKEVKVSYFGVGDDSKKREKYISKK